VLKISIDDIIKIEKGDDDGVFRRTFKKVSFNADRR
jgi:hypothetical protein